jgi:hypothetical protein
MFQSQHRTHKNPGSGWVTHLTKERFETTLFVHSVREVGGGGGGGGGKGGGGGGG